MKPKQDSSPRRRIEPRLDGPPQPHAAPPSSRAAAVPPRRRFTWVAIAGVLLLGAALAWFRQPLADRLWPDTRVQRLLDEGEAALRQGRLSAADGSGARQRFEAALALDNDRNEARDGLMRVGTGALAQARAELAACRLAQARQMLTLAQELQVPRPQSDAVAETLRSREAAAAGIDDLLRRAAAARAAGRIDADGADDDGADAALPLYQRVLSLRPDDTVALEAREDLLSDRLQQVRVQIEAGRLAEAAQAVAQVRRYDAGHVDLPDTQARLARALEQARRRADDDLRRGRLPQAAETHLMLRTALPDAADAGNGLQRVAEAYAARAQRVAADFDFEQAERDLQQARALAADTPAVKAAAASIARARQAQSRLAGTATPSPRQRRQVRDLLAGMARAEARGDWVTPPGDSAYDQLRAAQAIAPDDREVRAAAARLLPALQRCLTNELRNNRIARARACYDAWQAASPGDARLGDARRALASKWIAVGNERLGAGEIGFAAHAAQEARALDPHAPGLDAFAARVRDAQAGVR